ncbi:hypothetical protein D3C87_1347380 [compost metagenome]
MVETTISSGRSTSSPEGRRYIVPHFTPNSLEAFLLSSTTWTLTWTCWTFVAVSRLMTLPANPEAICSAILIWLVVFTLPIRMTESPVISTVRPLTLRARSRVDRRRLASARTSTS